MPTRLELPTEHPDVHLKGLVLGDARPFFEAVDASRDHLSRHAKDIPDTYRTQRQVENSIILKDFGDPTRLRMGIWSTSTLVGAIDLYPPDAAPYPAEIGYWLDSRHTGKGYATLAAKAMTGYGLEHYGAVQAEVMKDNIPSARVLERIGFEPVVEHTDTIMYKKTP